MPAASPCSLPHPVVGVLRQRRITNRALAAHLGLTPSWVGAVLLGYAPATPTFRSRVAALLELAETDLFHAPSHDAACSCQRAQ